MIAPQDFLLSLFTQPAKCPNC